MKVDGRVNARCQCMCVCVAQRGEFGVATNGCTGRRRRAVGGRPVTSKMFGRARKYDGWRLQNGRYYEEKWMSKSLGQRVWKTLRCDGFSFGFGGANRSARVGGLQRVQIKMAPHVS
jgi:hypothetical protein